MKQQLYGIQASFLVPTYNLPDDELSRYIVTQKYQLEFTTTTGSRIYKPGAIDVWLVAAKKDNPTQSMIESLRGEEEIYTNELKKFSPDDESEETKKKIAKLQHGKAVFANLISQAEDPVWHKKPDEEFLQIARNNFANHEFVVLKPDLKNYLYLAGFIDYEER